MPSDAWPGVDDVRPGLRDMSVDPARGGLRQLHGRSRDLALAIAALHDAERGRLRLLFVSGESGIGKTRLAEEIAGLGEAGGGIVLWGRGWAGREGTPPLWPWLQIVRRVVDGVDEDILRTALESGGAAVAAALPDVGRRFGWEARAADPTAPDVQFGLFEAITDLLAHVGRYRTIVVVLDDADSGDVASIRLLRFVARDPRSLRVLVVVNHKEPADAAGSSIGRALAQAMSEGCAVRLSLDGLNADAISDLLAEIQGARPPASVVAAVHAATAGNPLLVQEAARVLVDEDGRMWEPGERVLDGVREVVARRLQSLAPLARDVVEIGAVLDRHFRVGVIRHMLPDLTGSEVGDTALLDALDQAVRAHLVEAVPEQIGEFTFVHHLAQTAVYQALAPARRALLHRAAADALAALFGAGGDANVRTLAFHAREGLAAGFDPTRAVEWARRSARQCSAVGDHAAALDHCERALAAHEFTRGDEERRSVGRASLLVDLGRARAAVGHAGVADALDEATNLVQPFLANSEEACLVLADAASVHGPESPPDEADDLRSVARHERALAAFGSRETALAVTLLGRRAALLSRLGSGDRARRCAADALAMAERLSSSSASCEALQAHHVTHWNAPNVEARLAIASRMAERACERGDAAVEQAARTWSAVDLMDLGRVGEVEHEIEASTHLASAIGDPARGHHAACLRVALANMRGRFDEAATLADHALVLGERGGVRQAAMTYVFQMYTLHFERGQLEELARVQQSATRFFDDIPGLHALVALGALRLSRDDEARRSLAELGRHRFASVPQDGYLLSTAYVAALAAWDLRVPEVAAPLYAILRPHAHRNLLSRYGALASGSVWRGCAVLASLLERHDEADEQFERALAFDTAMGSDVFALNTRVRWGATLVARPDRAARARGEEMLAAAVETAAAMGMASLARLAHDAQAAAPAARRGPRSRWIRRGDVWEICFDGTTVHLRDSKGIRYLALLLARPDSDVHSTELVALADANVGLDTRPPDGLSVRSGLGDAGVVLDERARRAYGRELAELRAELDEATAANDIGRAAVLRERIGWLGDQIAAGTGLAGRSRVASSHAERCRLAVRQRVKATLRHCTRAHPALAAHLREHVKTGAFCRYVAEAGRQWDVA